MLCSSTLHVDSAPAGEAAEPEPHRRRWHPSETAPTSPVNALESQTPPVAIEHS